MHILPDNFLPLKINMTVLYLSPSAPLSFPRPKRTRTRVPTEAKEKGLLVNRKPEIEALQYHLGT